jgi:hypothetical protein
VAILPPRIEDDDLSCRVQLSMVASRVTPTSEIFLSPKPLSRITLAGFGSTPVPRNPHAHAVICNQKGVCAPPRLRESESKPDKRGRFVIRLQKGTVQMGRADSDSQPIGACTPLCAA